MTLADLNINEEAVIDCLDVDDESYHRRLNGMGFRCGSKIIVIRKSPFNGPIHVRVGTTDFAIRRSDAESIIVKMD